MVDLRSVDLNPKHLTIDYEPLKKARSLLLIPGVNIAYQRFFASFNVHKDFINLPSRLFFHTSLMRHWDRKKTEIQAQKGRSESDAAKEAAEWVKEQMTSGSMASSFDDESDIHFRFYTGTDQFLHSLRANLLYGVVGAWSHFEVLANDLLKFHQGLRLDKQDTKRFKWMRSLSTIKKEYTGVFGKDHQISHIFSDSSLNELDASRHVIVHCAVLVDERFLNATGKTYKLGSPLPMDVERASELINASIRCGVKLTRQVASSVLISWI